MLIFLTVEFCSDPDKSPAITTMSNVSSKAYFSQQLAVVMTMSFEYIEPPQKNPFESCNRTYK